MPRPFSWAYPTLMALSVLTGVLLARGRQRSLGLSARERAGVGLGAFCGAMIGAKLPFVLADWEGLLSGLAWFSNGKTIVFGLVGGYLGVELAKAHLQIRAKTGDSFAVPVAAAIAVGRLGCFVAGCCFGKETGSAWGVDFGDGRLRHPTQLYESAFHATALVALLGLERAGIWRENRIKAYFIAYLAYRFLSEWLRPEPIVGLGLTAYQWASLLLIGVFAALWARDAKGCPSPPNGRAASSPVGRTPAKSPNGTDARTRPPRWTSVEQDVESNPDGDEPDCRA